MLGSDINVYGTARAIHEKYGIKSIAYSSFQLAPTKYSKIVDVNIIPNFGEGEEFKKYLIDLAHTVHNDSETYYVLIPCGDGYSELLAKYKEVLEPYYSFLVNDLSMYEKLIDKASFYQTCEENGLPYPSTKVINKETYDLNLEDVPFQFPVALKPSNSIEWLTIDFEGKKKAFIIDSFEQLQETLAKIYSTSYSDKMILQEFIRGDDSHMRVMNAYVDVEGNVRMMFLGQPLLEDPAPIAVGNYTAILPYYNEDIYNKVADFLKRINFVGYANFDMKYDKKSNEFKFFEINLRQGRSSYFVTLNGINVPSYIIEDLVYKRKFTKTDTWTENQTPKLWIGTSKKIVRKYSNKNQAKKMADDLMSKGNFGTTLFYSKDFSIKRWILLHYINFRYLRSFKKYFRKKD